MINDSIDDLDRATIEVTGSVDLVNISAGSRLVGDRSQVTLVAGDRRGVTVGGIQVGFVGTDLGISIVIRVAIGIAIIRRARYHAVTGRAIAGRGRTGRPVRCA